MPSVEFEPTISAGELPQTYTLDRAATETGDKTYNNSKNHSVLLKNFEIFTVNRITLENCTRKVRNYVSGYEMEFFGFLQDAVSISCYECRLCAEC
jgi:hypothetical protein